MPLADLIKKRLRSSTHSLDSGASGSAASGSAAPDQPRSAGSPVKPGPAPRKRSVPVRELELLLRDDLNGLQEVEDDVFVSSGSNLSLSLDDVLGNPGNGAIAYFVQYLEARDASNLLKFWIDVEGFKSFANNNNNNDGRTKSAPISGDVFPAFEPGPASNPQSPVPPSNPDQPDIGPSGSTESFDSGFEADKSSPSESKSSHSKDALEIYQRYIAPDCPYPILLSQDTVDSIIQGICTESGELDQTCFDSAQSQIVKTLETEYFPDFLRSEGYAKHQLDVLTSGDVGMNDILYNDVLLFHFMEYMEGEGDRDLLEFWMSASNFRRNEDKTHLQSDAMVIYERFISMQASSSLGVSDALRSHIEEAICSEKGVKNTCFDPLIALIVRILQLKYLNSFLSSPLFRKYLSELLCQINSTPLVASTKKRLSGKKLRRSGSNTSLSTCSSSEVSISTQNTLLAMSRFQGDPLRRPSEDRSDLSLDSIDPDSLWKRKNHAMRNIAKVDGLGRYQSSFEQLPPGSGAESGSVGSKLSRAMKRLVSNDIGKVQEEMAWQMAEMMVNDVMSVTTSPEHSKSNASP